MRKKLLFFLLTAVCTLLCVPQNASAWTFYVDISNTTWSTVWINVSWNDSDWTSYRGTAINGSKIFKIQPNYENIQHMTITGSSGHSSNWGANVQYGDFTRDNGDSSWKVTDGALYVLSDTDQGATVTSNFDESTVPPSTLYWQGTGKWGSGTTGDTGTAMTKSGNTFTATITFSSNSSELRFADGSNYWGPTSSTSWGSTFPATKNMSKNSTGYCYQGLDAGTYNVTVTWGSTPTVKLEKAVTKVATPTFSPSAGAIAIPSNITISCKTSGATIYYTTNGSTPTTSSTRYSAPFSLTAAGTVKAIAVKSGMTNSDVASAAYTKAQCAGVTFSSTSVEKGTQLTISSNTTGATIHYSTDGGTTYKTATTPAKVTINAATTIKAYASKTGYINSAETTKNITVEERTYKLHSDFSGSWVAVPMTQLDNGTWRVALSVTGDNKEFGLQRCDENGTQLTSDGWLAYSTENTYATPGSNYTLTFSNTNNLKINKGFYVFTYDPSTKKLSVARDAHMPLTSASFSGGKHHYFLVGARMGKWHLQPEWEFTGTGTTLTIDGRYMYPTTFAIARVTSYDNYIQQIYDIYTNGGWVVNSSQTTQNGLTLGKSGFDGNSTKEWFRASDKEGWNIGNDDNHYGMWFNFGFTGDAFSEDENNEVKNSTGKWCKKITLTLASANGAPSSVSFDMSASTSTPDRIFQLVGENIYNKEFCNESADGKKTLMAGENDNMNGWQEGWIQYDEAGMPYYDANGNYVYHTVYQDSWFEKHGSYFNVDINGRNFTSLSENITFIDVDDMEDIDEDPYREFYKVYKGSKTISAGSKTGGVAADGTDFNFTASLKNNTASVTATDWKCYVVKEVYMKGQFKIWTGMGGVPMNKEGLNYGDTGARWNAANGGPGNVSAGTKVSVAGQDVTTGTSANLYRNGQNINAADYKADNLTFFNRVILWYSPTKGFAESFVQFIQESAGPAIQAYMQSGQTNKLYYEWGLNNYEGALTKTIKSYTVKRYRVDSEGLHLNGTTQDNISLGCTVAQFIATSGTTHYSNKLTFNDTKALDAGTYAYEVTITYTDGTVKKATSNKITIYDSSNAIKPTPVITQLVTLKDAAIDELISSASDRTRLKQTKTYLTYRQQSDATYYVVNELTTGGNITGAELIKVDQAKAKAIFNAPAKFTWSAHFFIRGLSEKAFNDKMNSFRSQGIITDEENPTPEVKFVDGGNASVEKDAFTCDLNGENYSCYIFDRNGSLKNDDFTVKLTYTVDGKTRNTEASVPCNPTIAKPFAGTFRYAYTRDASAVADVAEAIIAKYGLSGDEAQAVRDNTFYKLTMPSAVEDKGDQNVLIPEKDVKPRHLNCFISFQRPNLSDKIVAKYNIYYNIRLTNSDATDYMLDFNGVYYDSHTSIGSDYPYEIIINDVSPDTELYPILEIVETVYRPNDALSDPTRYLVAEFGKDVKIEAPNTASTESPTLGDVRWGVNLENADDPSQGYKWMYMGHKDFHPTTTDEIHSSSLDKTQYYMFELTAGSDYTCYPYLVKHEADRHSSGEWTTSENDALCGTWVAHNFSDYTTVPTLHLTPVYVFVRDPEHKNNPAATTTDLTYQGPLSAPRRAAANYDNLNIEKVGDEYHYTPAPDDGISGTYVAMAGTPVTKVTEDQSQLTGIEDIAAEGVEAEYFNLQGIRVINPEPGQIYIVRTGSKVEKMLVK